MSEEIKQTTINEAQATALEEALYKIATGYTQRVTKVYKLKDVHYDERGKKVETERLETATEEQTYPPNLSALTYWLKNRCPDRWGERREADEAENSGGIVILPEIISAVPELKGGDITDE